MEFRPGDVVRLKDLFRFQNVSIEYKFRGYIGNDCIVDSLNSNKTYIMSKKVIELVERPRGY